MHAGDPSVILPLFQNLVMLRPTQSPAAINGMTKRDQLFQAGTATSVHRRDKQGIKKNKRLGNVTTCGRFVLPLCMQMKRICFGFEIWSDYVAQVGLKLTTHNA